MIVASLRFFHVMSRISIRIIIASITISLCVGVGSASAQQSSLSGDAFAYAKVLAADEATVGMAKRVERVVKSLAWGGTENALTRVPLPEARDVALAYAIGSGEPSMAFVCMVSDKDEIPWSESVWLTIMDRLKGSRLSSPFDGTMYLFLLDEPAIVAETANHDFGFDKERLLPAVLTDMGIELVVILDFKHPPTRLVMSAASNSHMSPRAVLELAREAADFSGVDIQEFPVSDFYAAAGLASGSLLLAPWLEAGLPAVVIGSPADTTGSVDTGLDAGADVIPFFEAFARRSLQEPSAEAGRKKLPGDDVNYLRYPLPQGSLIVADHIIIGLTLLVLALAAIGFALGFLKGQPRRAQMRAVAREALSVLVLSMVALFGSNLLASVALHLAGFLEGRGVYATEAMSRWNSVLAIVLRFFCALSIYYVASGTASRLKLMGRHRRIDAARAALALLCINLLITVALMPAAAPFFILAIVICALFSETVLTTAIGLFIVVVVFIPFLDPRVIADMGYYAAGSGSIAAAILGAGARGTLALSALAAPFGLWLAAASSPDALLRRGRRTVLLWALAALALAAAEAILGNVLTGL